MKIASLLIIRDKLYKLVSKDIDLNNLYKHTAQGIVFNRKLAEFLITTQDKLANFINVHSMDKLCFLYAVIVHGKTMEDFGIKLKCLIFAN